MSSHTAARIALASAVLLGIVAPLSLRTSAVEAAPSQQVATPTHVLPATATARPPNQGIIGSLPRCDTTDTLVPSTVNVRVGDVVTVTATSRVTCPQLLRERGALFVIGGVPAWAVPSVRNGLATIVDALGAAGGGRIARLEVGEATSVPAWADSVEDRAAIANALREVDARRGGTAEQWSAALASAEQAFRALSPFLQPMLIVVDGLPPAVDRDEVTRDLISAIEACSDRVGHSVLVDVSDSGWMVTLPIGMPTIRSKVLIARGTERAERSVSTSLAEVMAAFQAPLDLWMGELRASDIALLAIAARPETTIRGGAIHWSFPAQGHSGTFEVQATYRTLDGSPTGEIRFIPLALRNGTGDGGSSSLSLILCIQPPLPRRIICPGAARATSTPFPLPPTPAPSPPFDDRTLVPSRTPSSTPTRPSIATSTTSPPARRTRAFIPLASRD